MSAASETARLEVIGLTVAYGHAVAVDGLSLRVSAGECVGVVGANGAGKSSLLRCIAGLLQPSGGSIRLEGRSVDRGPAWRLARAGLRIVPEGRELFGDLTVDENLRVGATLLPKGQRDEAVDATYQMFAALQGLRSRRARLLSGGEQQMLAIGRALVGRPKVLLLDEPSLGLSPIAVSALLDSLKQVKATGVSILIAEQGLRLPTALCEEVTVMRLGRSIAVGAPRDTLRSEIVSEAFLGASP